MEKIFAITQKTNGFEIPNIIFKKGGEVLTYLTLDERVSHLIVVGKYEWLNRTKTEVFRCPVCKSFILPGEVKRDKNGVEYHTECLKNRKYQKFKMKSEFEMKSEAVMEEAVMESDKNLISHNDVGQ